MHSQTFDALGTRWWLESLSEEPLPIEAVLACVTTFEHAYSRFKPDSLLSILNRERLVSNPPEEFSELLELCLSLQKRTHGLWNASVGGVLNGLGYGKSQAGRVSETLAEELHLSTTEIRFTGAAQLDFGGFGKGYLIDKLADLITKHGVEQWIINGGGDIRLQSRTPIELALEHPFRENLAIGTISLTSGSLACSAPAKRSWNSGPHVHHHIISPKTGTSFTNAAGSFVTAPTALEADCAATCFLLANNAQYAQLSKEFSAEYLLITIDEQFTRSPHFSGRLFT